MGGNAVDRRDAISRRKFFEVLRLIGWSEEKSRTVLVECGLPTDPEFGPEDVRVGR